ncbi:MAG: lgt [Rickettsiales bacterium]|jgi:phosphatidylglycerol:prolipoprotein diacylglycerol transferase|nr:lgt [Rickettsiales bacterium]
MAIGFPDIDPIIVSFGPFAIRWYALAYVVGILGGWWYIGKLNRREPQILSAKQFDDIMLWAVFGIILGGRLGYVLFYQPAYFLSNPIEILQMWHGGMSFHGGLIGTILATYLFSRKNKLAFWSVVDLLACATPLGLGLGRLANFINGELYGRATDVAWAVMFPMGGFIPRHPSQLYEAFLEGVVLFSLLAWLALKTRARMQPGFISGVFLVGYATARMIVECFREPDEQLGFLLGGNVTMGQLLSLPMLLFGIYLMQRAMRMKIVRS